MNILKWTAGYPWSIRWRLIRMMFRGAWFHDRWWPNFEDAREVGELMQEAIERVQREDDIKHALKRFHDRKP